jgi:hypothetical protein
MRKALTSCTVKCKETIKEIRDNNTTGDDVPGDVLKLYVDGLKPTAQLINKTY